MTTAKPVDSAGHLEIQYGDHIRAAFDKGKIKSDGLAAWLLATHSVRVSVRTCETWLTKEWSSSGGLYTAEAVEEALGQRLRLVQYREQFGTDVH